MVKQFWLESQCLYGYRNVTKDLRDLGKTCSKERIRRLMKSEGVRSQTGYKRRQGKYSRPSVIAPNQLNQRFDVESPNQAWVTDITYIRTHEGWLYLAVVIDLYFRMVIGWSMCPWINSDVVVNALLMAVFRRRPKGQVIIHSDQGPRYDSQDWLDFLKAHGLSASMSWRGNCHDNAVAESFFQLLKRERVRKRIYNTRDQARADIFNYIEMFYNPKRRHSAANDLSPVQYKQHYFQQLQSV